MVSPESASVSEKGPLLDKLRSISQRYRVSRVLDPGRRCCPPRRQAHSGWSHLGLVHWPLCCPWSPNLSTSWGGVPARAPGIIAALKISSARAGASVRRADVGP